MPATPLITDWSVGEVSEKMHGRFDLPLYNKGASLLDNFMVMPQGGITKRPGTMDVASLSAKTRLITWVISDTLSYVLQFSAEQIIVRKTSDDAILSTITTGVTYSAEDIWDLQYSQDNNGIYFTHRSYAPQGLVRVGSTLYWGNLTFTFHGGGDYEYHSAGTPATDAFAESGNWPRSITTISGRIVLGSTANDPQRFWMCEAYGYSIESNALNVELLMWDDISYTYDQLTDPSTWVDTDEDGYPDPDNETITIDRDVTNASHAIDITLASDENDEIQWMAAGRDLIIGTTASEWTVPHDVSAIAPRAQLGTRFGSSLFQGKLFADSVIFLQAGKTKLRQYMYNAESGYASPDLTFFSDHIFNTGVEDFDFQQEPHSALYFTKTDGQLAVLTYEPMTGTQAWQTFTHATGNFESVCVAPYGDTDVVYVATNTGGTRRIEKFTAAFPTTQGSGVWMDATVDCSTGGAGNNPTETRFIDADVDIVIDGVYNSTQTANGSGLVDLTGLTGTQVWVGFKYTAKATTLPLVLKPMHIQRISNLYLRLYRTMDLSVGFETWTAASMDSFANNTWQTVDYQLPFRGGHDRECQVNLMSAQPEPCTITALYMEAT